MTTTQDVTLGLGVESTFGTPVATSRGVDYVPGSAKFAWVPIIKQSNALRVGRRFDTSDRRVLIGSDVTGEFTAPVQAKGMGLLFQALFGTATSTLVSTGLYQQVFTWGDDPSSLTLQRRLVTSAGTTSDETFSGMMVDSVEFDFPAEDIITIKPKFLGKSLSTATAYTPPTYTTSPSVHHFGSASVAGGAYTAPTTTVLASGTTPIAVVRSAGVTLSRNLRKDRNLGGGGLVTRLQREIPKVSGRAELEFLDVTYRDALLNQTDLPLLLSSTIGTDVFQIGLPRIRLDGDLAESADGSGPVQSVSFSGMETSAGNAITAVLRTSDTAL